MTGKRKKKRKTLAGERGNIGLWGHRKGKGGGRRGELGHKGK